jgi:chromosome segregation protein
MLQSLELFGFKSFADRTIFDFAAGITGVVGPNGSGKSNVVDSIKWILGDQSARSLRGKEMTDVIFNGSASRTGSQFAEATLVFDNRSRFLPLDQDRVSIGRRLWQSGDSEYLINRNTARLKDVRDLFLGTGAGAAAYCIIEQGRVDQILQSNAANRRLIFEEAAGITRFKQKRTEALKRLERVEQNLTRLADLVDEVETQVSAVRNQAQRAAQFRSVSSELELLWIGLAADDFRLESVERDQLAALKSGLQTECDTLRARQSAAAAEARAADTQLAEAEDQLRNHERRRSETQSRIASLESTVHHQAAREQELLSDLQRLTRQQSLLESRVSEAIIELAHLESVLTLEREALERRRGTQLSGDEQVTTLQQELLRVRQELEQARQDLVDQVRANSEVAAARSGLQMRAESVARRTAELNDQTGLIQQEIAATLQRQVECEARATAARRNSELAEQAVDEHLQSRDGLLTARTHSQQSLAELRELRSAQLARRAVLEDLEDRQEGLGLGVREILRRAESTDAEPWNLICGSVADLLDVDLEHAALLEVALAGRAQLLVVTRRQPLIDYLTSGRCRITDRVGFISMEQSGVGAAELRSLRNRSRTLETHDDPDARGGFESRASTALRNSRTLASGSDEPALVTWVDPRRNSHVERSVFDRQDQARQSLFGQPGVVGRADGLARPSDVLPDLAAHLLADTWIVESLPVALRLHAGTSGQCRFVTLQGELIETDGTLFAGTVRNETALLSRKSELRRLRNELHRLDHEIAERELRLRAVGEDLSTADAQLRAARERMTQAAEDVHAADRAGHELLGILATAREKVGLLDAEQERLREEADRLQQQLTDAAAAESAGELELQLRQSRISELAGRQAGHQQDLESRERERTAASLELTRLEERLVSLQEAVDRVREDLLQRRMQRQEADRRLQLAVSRQSDLHLASLNARAEIAELLVADEQEALEIRRHSATRNTLRLQRASLLAAENEVREQVRDGEARWHELNMRIQGLEQRLTHAADRIREEFQIEVRQAVAEGRSAISHWLSRATDEAAADAPSAGTTGARPAAMFSAAAAAVLQDPQRWAELRAAIEQRLDQLRRQLKRIGSVSTESLDNLLELETRYQRLHTQLTDLQAARDALQDIVRRINAESRRLFVESFEVIRGYFRELFRKLFGGGDADLVLEDPEDVLECAIEVVARPPGKELRSISLLSGGEKTLTAVALLLSIFRSRSSPFCILDEVDAALDDANIGRFVGVLREFQQNTQFIMITHRKPTMAVTDVLYGVTMEESGISRRLSLRFDDVDERGHFNPKSVSAARAA